MKTTLRRNLTIGLLASFAGTVCVTALLIGSSGDVRVVNAAMKGDREAVRALLKQAADVNAAQGDGMTALHWAALNGDAEMAQTLIYAGANLRAATRIGGYSPLFMAAKSGASSVIDVLLKAGADAKAQAGDGLTPLMMASMAGDPASVRVLVEHGADVNAREAELGQTSLMFAAAFDRPDVIEELARHGADLDAATPVKQPPPQVRGFQQNPVPPAPAQAAPPANAGQAAAAGTPATGRGAPVPPAAQPQQQQQQQQGPDTRGGGNPHGGLTPLMYAARDGSLAAAQALLKAGARLDEQSGDKSTALLLAAINGKFDLASFLVEHDADVNLVSMDGAAPLYAVVHTQWSRESFHPQPSIKRERTSYLDLMSDMLDHGANPNARLTKVLWYSSYGYAYESASEIGTTPFWRCAAVADVDGMKLLISRGADPKITNKDGVDAFLVASGAGTHGNDEVNAPAGRMTAVRYLVEDLQFDVNAADNGSTFRGESVQQARPPQQQPNPFGGMTAAGFTALHNAASRGDNEMILYLVSKGARVDAVTNSGVTVADMANGPRQRVQPFPDTVALLEILGSKNSHKCVSC
jgi:uncharacterized protein